MFATRAGRAAAARAARGRSAITRREGIDVASTRGAFIETERAVSICVLLNGL